MVREKSSPGLARPIIYCFGPPWGSEVSYDWSKIDFAFANVFDNIEPDRMGEFRKCFPPGANWVLERRNMSGTLDELDRKAADLPKPTTLDGISVDECRFFRDGNDDKSSDADEKEPRQWRRYKLCRDAMGPMRRNNEGKMIVYWLFGPLGDVNKNNIAFLKAIKKYHVYAAFELYPKRGKGDEKGRPDSHDSVADIREKFRKPVAAWADWDAGMVSQILVGILMDNENNEKFVERQVEACATDKLLKRIAGLAFCAPSNAQRSSVQYVNDVVSHYYPA